jgi:hypothetical protein
VLVSVRGHTNNAMAFVADDPARTFSAFSEPLLFGARQADVCAGAQASLVDVEFKIEYYADASQPIVDNQYFGNDPSDGGFPDDPFEFRSLMFRAHGDGTLADGSPARLTVNQTGIFQPHSNSPKYDGFPVEFINLHPTGGKAGPPSLAHLAAAVDGIFAETQKKSRGS